MLGPPLLPITSDGLVICLYENHYKGIRRIARLLRANETEGKLYLSEGLSGPLHLDLKEQSTTCLVRVSPRLNIKVGEQ